MNKQTIINRLEALDLSQYPYFEIKELIRDLGKVGFIIFTLHPGKTITRARAMATSSSQQSQALYIYAQAEKLYEMIERTRTEREMQVCSFCPCSTMDQLSL